MNLVLAAALFAALILGALYVFQGKLVYFPVRSMAGDPSDIGLEYEDVRIDSGDAKLHGWFVPAGGSRACVLFFHGNAGNVSHRLDTVELIHGLGLSLMIFDYRGYGKSTGSPGEEGTYRDAEAAWRRLTGESGFEPSEIVLWGRSLGGAIAVKLASEVRPAALILESTFTSVPDMGRRLYPFLPVGLLARIRYPAKEYVRRVECPVLVIHSPEDEIVPFSMGRELYESAPESGEFLEIRGSHNLGFLESGSHYRDGVASFLSETVGVRIRR
jgi:hypothetical protein